MMAQVNKRCRWLQVEFQNSGMLKILLVRLNFFLVWLIRAVNLNVNLLFTCQFLSLPKKLKSTFNYNVLKQFFTFKRKSLLFRLTFLWIDIEPWHFFKAPKRTWVDIAMKTMVSCSSQLKTLFLLQTYIVHIETINAWKIEVKWKNSFSRNVRWSVFQPFRLFFAPTS